MKSSKMMHVCVTGVLIVGAVSATCWFKSKKCCATNSDSVTQVIHQRKSVRKYTEQKVSKEQLTTVVRAAMAAPTARNSQPWRFVVVSHPDSMKILSAALPNAKMLTEAPAAIIVCGDTDSFLPEGGRDFWVQDCAAANENLLLQVEGMGLGAVWIGVHPIEERVSAVKKQMNLPENWIPFCVDAIGYPTGIEQPKNKWKPENVLWFTAP